MLEIVVELSWYDCLLASSSRLGNA